MGSQSSQLAADGHVHPAHRGGGSGGKVSGPPASPTTSENGSETGRVFGPALSPLTSDDETNRPAPSSRLPSKKNKKKRRKGVDGDLPSSEANAADEDAEDVGNRRKRKKKTQRKHAGAGAGAGARAEQEEGHVAVVEDTQRDEEAPSPKRKPRKRKKKTATRDVDDGEHGAQDDTHKDGPAAEEGDHAHHREDDHLHSEGELRSQGAARDGTLQPALGIVQTPFVQKKKRKRNKKHDAAQSPDARQVLLPHADGGSPPSAQRPEQELSHILRYERLSEDEAGQDTVFTSSHVAYGTQRRGSGLPDLRPTKLEHPEADDDGRSLPGLAGSFADAVRDPEAEAMRDDSDPTTGLTWLHKRKMEAANDTPIIDESSDREMKADMALPDLQQGQIKTERESESSTDSGGNTDSSSASDTDSPSVARLDRLSRSRSRSVASTSRSGAVADQVLGLIPATRQPSRPASRGSETTTSSPSSIGSNTTIPARLDVVATNPPLGPSTWEPRPQSRPSRSRSGDVEEADAAMQAAQPLPKSDATPPKKRAQRAIVGKKKTRPAAESADEIDGHNHAESVPEVGENGIDHPDKSRQGRGRRTSNTGLLNGDVHLMSDRLPGSAEAPRSVPAAKPDQDGGVPDDELPIEDMPHVEDVTEPTAPARQLRKTPKRKAKPSVALDDEGPELADGSGNAASAPGPMAESVGAADASQKTAAATRRTLRQQKLSFPQAGPAAADKDEDALTVQDAPGASTTAHNDSVGPEESDSQPQPQPQPKGRKKRNLQGKTSLALSLSQIEGDEDAAEGQSRLSTFSQKAKVRDATRGGSNEAEQSEVGVSQEASPVPKTRKTKRRRRTTDASEDELESLLAAGPSKSRKKARTLDLSDDEGGKKGKRKRASMKDKATGRWQDDELRALGRVVDEFRDAHGMTQHEMNQLIHEVPKKTDDINQDFWNKADLAIPRRTRKQIAERTRRLYNNFVDRYKWTDEQKEEVHELFEKYPKKWAEIAGMINRDQKDIRDYWRNHYVVLENQIKSRWSEEEEARFKEVVEEALHKIRIMRENNDDFRPRPRAHGTTDDALLDWQQISAAMNLSRSARQCRWKWTDLREKGLVGGASILLPRQPRSSAGVGGSSLVTGVSEELGNAREDFRGMSEEDLFRLVEAIYESGARDDTHIRWSGLVDERFRTKWHRPSLKLAWYRLRNSCPDYNNQGLETNARHLLNYYAAHRAFRRLGDNQVDEQVEEKLVRGSRGSRIWKRPSDDPRAIRERQRRSSSASSRASSRLTHRVSSEILRLDGSDDESRPDVSIRIPKHLKGEEAKKALAKARAKATAKAHGNAAAGGARSASVAIDSDSE